METIEKTQICKTCNKELPYDEYHRTTDTKSGRRSECKTCVSEKNGHKRTIYKGKICLKCNKRKPFRKMGFHDAHGPNRRVQDVCIDCRRDAPRTHKRCKKCEKSLPIELFQVISNNSDGYKTVCNICSPIKTPLPEGHKKCSKCKEILLFGMFHQKSSLNKDGTNAYASWCKDCIKENQKPRSGTDQYLKANLVKFNLTVDRYYEILESQGGHCAMCLKTPEMNGKRLCVDHDHKCCDGGFSCGQCIRGLLCTHHNMMIGYANDSIEELQSGIEYLQREYISNK